MKKQTEQQKIGYFIKEMRERRGMTQEAFAKELGTSQSSIPRMEKGEQNFTTELLSKISKVLDHQIVAINDSIDFQVNGGKKLSGSIKTNFSKNGSVGLLCASLLNKGITTLHGIARIEEVNRVIEILESIGVQVKWIEANSLQINPPKKLNLENINVESAIRTRSVVMLMGPLIHLFPNFKLPHAQGCNLGKRTIAAHTYAFLDLGVKVKTTANSYEVTSKNLKPADIIMYESGDTPTENAIMAAVAAKGTTVIKMASANYMVADLCIFLQSVGAEISGVGTTTLTVVGGQSMATGVKYAIMPDPIVCMTLMATAIVTGSRLTIKNCPMEYLELELCKLEVMGQKFKIKNKRLSANNFFQLADIEIIPSKLTALPDKIEGRPFPGLNIDNLPLFVPILAKAQGRTLVHDWAYENRAVYSLELQRLGVNVTLLDPHRIWVEGPTKFKHNEVIAPPALRPAVNVFICMLAAKGQSILRNTYEIDRGYENLYAVLNSVGADVQVISK